MVLGSREVGMEDSSAIHLSDEVQDPGRGSSDASVGSSLRDSRGKEAVAAAEPVREELVQSAVGFLKHPKVVASSDVQRRSFLEKKGLTVDEIDEAFRRLLSPSSNSMSPNSCTYQGRPEPETESVDPVVPRHPKSYMEIMEMIQRGERPDDIQDINDDPPNPDQPISESLMAPKPKPWEKQGQESSIWELKSQSMDTIESRSEIQLDSTNQFTETENISNQGDSLLLAETVAGSEAHTDDAASTKS
uniref:Peroxisomal membrane protein PEX14 n=1 Tax=Oryza meridionalis TaxID=40149 RepID=A0A0E0DUT0_9ORYZ